MNTLRATVICGLLAMVSSGCRVEDGDDGSYGGSTPQDTVTSPDPAADWCPSNTYVGDIGGLSGTARLSYEVGLTVIYVGGEITSETAQYSFSGCELYRDDYTGMPTNNVCWVDVVDLYYGERFRAEIQFYEYGSERGFYLTANAYEGAYSTSYGFICQ